MGESSVGGCSSGSRVDSQEGQKDLESKSWGVETAGSTCGMGSNIACKNSIFFYQMIKKIYM